MCVGHPDVCRASGCEQSSPRSSPGGVRVQSPLLHGQGLRSVSSVRVGTNTATVQTWKRATRHTPRTFGVEHKPTRECRGRAGGLRRAREEEAPRVFLGSEASDGTSSGPGREGSREGEGRAAASGSVVEMCGDVGRRGDVGSSSAMPSTGEEAWGGETRGSEAHAAVPRRCACSVKPMQTQAGTKIAARGMEP